MAVTQPAALDAALSIIGRMRRRDFLLFSSTAVAALAGGVSLPAAAATLRTLDANEASLFHRIAQAVLPVEGSPLAPWKADVLLQTLDVALLGTMPAHVLAGLKGGLRFFDEGPRARYGRRFAELDTASATRFLDEWGASDEIPHRALATGLKKLVQLSYWANPESWGPLGYDGPISKKNGLKSLGNAPLPQK